MVAWPTEDRLRMLPSLFRKDPGEELLNLFDPDFIKMFTPGVVKAAFADEAQKRSPCLRIVSIERLQGPWHGRAVLEFKDMSRLQCDVMVAEVYPHQFTYVRLDSIEKQSHSKRHLSRGRDAFAGTHHSLGTVDIAETPHIVSHRDKSRGHA